MRMIMKKIKSAVKHTRVLWLRVSDFSDEIWFKCIAHLRKLIHLKLTCYFSLPFCFPLYLGAPLRWLVLLHANCCIVLQLKDS
ncbi:hypothetical protein L6164_018214 [Bauhinia variegata]|uniref:Uncharacterized protein n=1 Tax=Bauhinia variegata TaxID=167791 RepID=A0ACB9NBI7_BAUVA|nr:hypothetical protein L6164_018214 [Bauhinia variegata]